MRIWLIFTVLLHFLAGCATHDYSASVDPTFNLTSVIDNKLFPSAEKVVIESEEQIFALPKQAKLFIDDYIKQFRSPDLQVYYLAQGLFDRQQMGMIYINEANTIAKDTYLNARANCLSLTILAYALADYAGFDAKFQQVKIPENWVRRDNRSLLNGHINLKIRPKIKTDKSVALSIDGMFTEIDFNRPQQRYNKSVISKKRVIAMYYNNKGADFLIQKQYSHAFAYFRAAVKTDSKFVPALTNLGALYRILNSYDIASKLYTNVMYLEPDNLNNLENLAILKEHLREFDQASEIRKLIDKRRKSNPFYYLIKGEEAFDNGDYADALVALHHAVRLDSHIHEVYFALAKTYYMLGDFDMSEQNLKLAKRNSLEVSQKNRYKTKLELLTRNYQ